MLVRIVKLTFDPTKINLFLENFHKHKIEIRNFEGCRLLEVYQDKNKSNLFFSYSYWDSEETLENYRNSELFSDLWNTIKVYFIEKPEAWSVDKYEVLN